MIVEQTWWAWNLTGWYFSILVAVLASVFWKLLHFRLGEAAKYYLPEAEGAPSLFVEELPSSNLKPFNKKDHFLKRFLHFIVYPRIEDRIQGNSYIANIVVNRQIFHSWDGISMPRKMMVFFSISMGLGLLLKFLRALNTFSFGWRNPSQDLRILQNLGSTKKLT